MRLVPTAPLIDARHQHGMTIAACAAALKMSESMVSKIEQQALAKLREMFSRRDVTMAWFPRPGAGVSGEQSAPFDGVDAPEIEG